MGSTVFGACSGVPAFEAEDNSLRVLLRGILKDPVPDLRPLGVPDAICTVIERAMAKDPDERQPSALQFGIELARPADEALLHGADYVLQLQGIRQGSNLPLFAYTSVAAFGGLRWRW